MLAQLRATRNRRRPVNCTKKRPTLVGRLALRLIFQRIGGAYCRPPFDHSAFTPREIFSGEPAPTLRSKLSL
jgi:hypothetical protein